jgi:hypothetical protein
MSGDLEKYLDILGGVSAGTPVGGNARNQDVRRGSVISGVDRLWPRPLFGAGRSVRLSVGWLGFRLTSIFE